jgi:hypothetical protein
LAAKLVPIVLDVIERAAPRVEQLPELKADGKTPHRRVIVLGVPWYDSRRKPRRQERRKKRREARAAAKRKA